MFTSLVKTKFGLAVIAVIMFAYASTASALPRFSLLTGTRCSACHFNPQGSGIRTELGWSVMNETGLFKWRDSQNDTIAATNTMFGGKVIPGLDARGQIVRLSTTGQRVFIPMQLTTSVAFMPAHELSVYTNVNLASIEERIRGGSLYPGETDFDAAIQFQPDITLPSIRVGMIEPSIGIRQDDHTVFVNRDAAPHGGYIFPAYYNDMGAELTYEGLKFLSVNAGIFNAYYLAQVDPSIGVVTSNFDFSHPTLSGRVMLWPQLLEQAINGEVGGSIMVNGSMKMINGFIGLGLTDKATLYLEGVHSTNADNRILRNFTVMGTYQLAPWLTAEWRADWGQTELYPGKSLVYSQAFTLGAEFFPLPYIEIRPEYRLYQSQPFYGQGTYTGQWTGQLHVFY
jgi:hypothetical protein